MFVQSCRPLGGCTVQVPDDSAVGFSSGIVSDTTAFVVPQGAGVISLITVQGTCTFRDDGIAPTPSTGVQLTPGQEPFEYSGAQSAIRFCSVSGTVALSALFYQRVG